MSKFVLTAQLQLQAPTNTSQVLNQVRQDLKGVTVPVSTKGAVQAQKQLDAVANSAKKAGTAADSMGRSFGLAIKRFAAFTVASRAVSLVTNSLANAVDEAINFQREIVKISQVTGKTVKELRGLQKTITDLAVNLGTSSAELLGVARILSQAGIAASDLDVALKTLAKTTLAPTFTDINQTAEGAVAILSQFGQGVGALEKQLSAINAVAGQFAVESGDLIGAVRRFGGVFKAAGGSLEELIALFTSVRATTRESAESISTGLRTIFTRIQRPRTLDFLKDMGIELRNLQGRFIGPYQAAQKLSEALANIDSADPKFIRIAEELGGFRQIGKVIPLLQQFETAERARIAAIAGGNSLTEDAATAQQALAVQITSVKEEFLALIRSISESGSFQIFVRSSLELASALIKITDAIKPLLPLITALAAVSFARGLGTFLGGAGSAVRGLQNRNQGGKIQKFARGGYVPGSGNGDTVPAMLQPGEFVIKKSSAAKLGSSTLEAMNQNRFANAGVVKKSKKAPSKGRSGPKPLVTFQPEDNAFGGFFTELQVATSKSNTKRGKGGDFRLTRKSLIDKFTGADKSGTIQKQYDELGYVPATLKDAKYSALTPSLKSVENGSFRKVVKDRLARPLADAGSSVVKQIQKEKLLDFSPQIETNEGLADAVARNIGKDDAALSNAAGYLNEGIISAFTQAKPSGGNANFDFNRQEISKNKERFSGLFGRQDLINKMIQGDAKSKQDKEFVFQPGGLPKKVSQEIDSGGSGSLAGIKVELDKKTNIAQKALGGLIQRFAIGGKAQTKFPLVDDILSNATGSILPNPKNIAEVIKAGGAALDVDRTLIRTLGDKAYSRAKTDAARTEVLNKYFRGEGRLRDLKSSPVTQFGKEVQAAVKDKKVSPSNLKIISKSRRTPGSAEYLNKLFSVPLENIIFTQGREKQSALNAFNTKGPRANRVKRASGGIMPGSGDRDTVPALLTPGEFVVNKKSAQSIGYSNLSSMNKSGVSRFAKGGSVGGVQKLAGGGQVGGSLLGGGFTSLALVLPAAQIAVSKLGDTSETASDSMFLISKRSEFLINVLGIFAASLLAKKFLFDKIDGWIGKPLQKAGEAATANAQAQSEASQEIKASSKDSKKSAASDSSDDKTKKPSLDVVPPGKRQASQIGAGAKIGFDTSISPVEKVNLRRKQSKRSTNAVLDAGSEFDKQSAGIKKEKKTQKELAGIRAKVQTQLKGIISATARLNSLRAKGTVSSFEEVRVRQVLSGEITKQTAALKTTVAQRQKTKQSLVEQQSVLKDQNAALKPLLTAQKQDAKNLRVAEKQLIRNTLKQQRYSTSLGRLGAAFGKGNTLLGKAGFAVRQFGGEIDRLRKKASGGLRGSFSAGGAGRRAIGGIGKVGGAIGIALTAISSGIRQYTQIQQEVAKRQETKARDRGDVAGSAKAAEKGAVAASIGEVASIGGIFQLFSDPRGFVLALKDKVQSAGAEGALTTVEQNAQNRFKELQNTDEAPDFDKIISGQVRDSAAARKENSETETGDARTKREEKLSALNKKTLTDLIKTGAERGKLISAASKLADGNRKLSEEYQKLVKVSVNLREAQAQLAKANFDSLKITSAFQSANNAVLNFSKSLVTGSGELDGYIAEIENARNTIGTDSTNAVTEITKALLSSAGGANTGLGQAVTGQANVAAAGAAFTRDIGKAIELTPINLNDGAGIAKKELERVLTSAIPDDASGAVRDQIGKVIFKQVQSITEDNFSGFDISKTLAEVSKDTAALSTGFFEAAKLQSAHNQSMTKLYSDRESLEVKAVDAANKAIDAQIEAAKIFEDFGGKRLEPSSALQGRVAQFNNVGAAGGLGASLSTGTASDITRVAAELGSVFLQGQRTLAQDITARSATGGRGGGVFAGAGGFAADKRPEAQRANDALIQFTKQRITLLKEELSLVQKKNAEEKSSLEKLITGDIAGFLQGQAAAGAGTALRSGDSSLTGLFSAQALGTGFKTLLDQESGLSDRELQDAAGAVLSRLGIADPRSAAVLAGTTPEEQAIKAQGKELAGALGGLAQQQAEFARSDITIADATITASRLIFSNELNNVANTNQGVLGRANGGQVYASRGMFVPRGTDTVPAMLTPGEFVINRAAVRRGNNLQMLKAMNSGGGPSGGTNGTAAMSSGGQVKYYQQGGAVEGVGSIFQAIIPDLRTVFNDFATTVDKLLGTKFNVALDTTNVNVNFNGGSFLASLKDDIKESILDEVLNEVKKLKQNHSGDLQSRNTVL